jgi:hypothetical protein
MVTHTFVDLELEEARYLADLTGVEFDLQSAIRLSELLIKRIESSEYDGELLDALSTAIVVRYSRAFVSGVRRKLEIGDIPDLNEKELKEHKWLIETRNKHIAHSVNEFEENQVVGYYILESPEEKGITSISVQHGRVIGLSYKDASSVIDLSKKILEYVAEEIKKEKSKLLSLVRQKDINEILPSGKQTAFRPDMSKADKRRK